MPTAGLHCRQWGVPCVSETRRESCRVSEMLRLCLGVCEEEMKCCKFRLTVTVGPEMGAGWDFYDHMRAVVLGY